MIGVLFFGSALGGNFSLLRGNLGLKNHLKEAISNGNRCYCYKKTRSTNILSFWCVFYRGKIHSSWKKSTQSLRLWMAPPAAGGKITLVGSNKIITLHKHARTVTMTAVGCPSPSNFIFIGVMFWWVHLSYQSQSDTILQSTLGRIVCRRCFTGISPHDGNNSRLEF